MRPTTSLAGIAALALVAGTGCGDAPAAPEVPEEVRAELEQTRARLAEAPMATDPTLDRELLARAEPTRAKVNQTDISSGARSGDFAYFGTTANIACVMSQLFIEGVEPFASDDLACELEGGPGRLGIGDHRAPRILRVDLATDAVVDVTPADGLLRSTVGLFAAAAHLDVVLLAGPNLGPEGLDGLNVFAIEGSTGRVLASERLYEYASFSNGVVVNDALYLGATGADPLSGSAGYVLRWIGDESDPLRFETVGALDSAPGAIVEHEGRIAVAGHAKHALEGDLAPMATLSLSPRLPSEGLQEADQEGWERIFAVDDYEPDPVIARATSFGGLASFRGRLYFTTAQSPFAATMAAFDAYGRPDAWWDRLLVHAHTARAAAVFVMDEAGTDRQEVTLLYGDEQLPIIDPATGGIEGRPNNLGQQPRFGPAGLGSPFNHMTTLAVFEDSLYLGTFDGSTIAAELLRPLVAQEALLDLPEDVVDVLQPIADLAVGMHAGADLYRMDAPYAPFVAEDLTGLGNPSNYGLSVLLPAEDGLYIGTSNPFNLRTGEEAPGGYELLKLTPTVD